MGGATSTISASPLYTLNSKGNILTEGPVRAASQAAATYTGSGGPTGTIFDISSVSFLVGTGATGISALVTVGVPTGTWTGTTAYYPFITYIDNKTIVVRVNKVTNGSTAPVEAANGEVTVNLTVIGLTDRLPP
jgi:hypothetical protein